MNATVTGLIQSVYQANVTSLISVEMLNPVTVLIASPVRGDANISEQSENGWQTDSLNMKTKLKKPIRRRSKSLERRLKEYYPVRDAYMEAHPICENPQCRVIWKMRQPNKSQELHHKRGRIGRLLCDVRFYCALCSPCHRWVDYNRPAARLLGILCQLGEWGKQEP